MKLKNLSLLFLSILFFLLVTSSAKAEELSFLPPVIEDDVDMESGKNVTYDCVFYGSYPQREVIPYNYDEIEATVSTKVQNGNDYIVDSEIYNKLKATTNWDENSETVIDGEKYKKLEAGSGLVYGDWDLYESGFRVKGDVTIFEGSYEYENVLPNQVFYFKYEPVKWRVLSLEDDKLVLMSDIVLDGAKLDDLTKCAKKIADNAYVLSEDVAKDMYSEEIASKSSTYAKAVGVISTIVNADVSNPVYKGNAVNVGLLSNGKKAVDAKGKIANITEDDIIGVRPMISIDVNDIDTLKYAGKTSTHIVDVKIETKHQYITDFVWAKNSKTANVTFKCSDCGKEEKVKAKVHKFKVVEESGNQTLYVAIAECDGCVVKDERRVNTIVGKPYIKSISNAINGTKLTFAYPDGSEAVEIYRKVGNGSYKRIKTVKRNTFIDTTAVNGKYYSYYIKAVASYDKKSGMWLTTTTASKRVRILYLNNKTGAKIKKLSNNRIKITWKKNSKADFYQIVYKCGKVKKTYKVLGTSKVIMLNGRNYKASIRCAKKYAGKIYYSIAFDIYK